MDCGSVVVRLETPQLVNQVVGGHLGLQEMAAVALGSMWFNMLWCFVMGVATALDTLASQAFGAADIPLVRIWSATAGVVLLTLCIPLAAGLWMAGAAAERFFHQPDDVASLVALYCRLLIPGAVPLALVLVLNKFLQAQNIMKPSACAGLLGFSTNLAVNVLLLHRGGLGVKGPALATSSGNTLQAIFLSGCVAHHLISRRRAIRGYSAVDVEMSKRSSSLARDGSFLRDNSFARDKPLQPYGGITSNGEVGRNGTDYTMSGPAGSEREEPSHAGVCVVDDRPSRSGTAVAVNGSGRREGGHSMHRENSAHSLGGGGDDEPVEASVMLLTGGISWQHVGQFLRLGIPGGFMFFLELAGFELTTAMAGAIDTVSLDAHTAMISVCAFTFVTLPFGVATAATIRVGNNLGAGRAGAARCTSYIALLLGGGFMAMGALPIFLFRHRIGSIFVDSDAVRDAVARIAPLAAIFQVFDGIGGCSLGSLRGMGRQATAAAINMVGFWVVMVFFAYMFAFVAHMGLMGIWWGILSGIGMTAVIGTGMILSTDWEYYARRAIQMQRGAAPDAADATGEGTAGGGAEGLRDFADGYGRLRGHGVDRQPVMSGKYVRINSSVSEGEP
eukprot:jgi/Mesvir1/13973/Mv15838-RA.1